MKSLKKLVSRMTRQVVDLYYNHILYVDLTDDFYQVVENNDGKWSIRDADNVTTRISEWFEYFANSVLCHPRDREQLLKMSYLDYIINLLEKNDYQPLQFMFKRKWHVTDTKYSDVKMDIVPIDTEDGHNVVFLLIRNVMNEAVEPNERLPVIYGVDSYQKRSPSDKRKLLIIEDNELNLELLCEILGDEYEIYQAKNGLEGMKILEELRDDISLVLLDIQMPIMDGYQFLEERANNPFYSEIPVIVTTVSDRPEEEELCLQKGATDFVTKPYKVNVIKSRVKSIIKLRESETTLSAVERDELTGLYTKQAFIHHAEKILKRNSLNQYDLLLSDIEDFEIFGDHYGSATRDNLMRDLAAYIQEITGDDILLGRYGDSQFAALYVHKGKLTESRLAKAREAMLGKSQVSQVVIKFGLYEKVPHDVTITSLCERTLSALQSVKHKYNRVLARYDEEMQMKQERLRNIELSMMKALENDEFRVFYQPKHDANTGNLVGAEALIRWQHPELGFLSPTEFIPLFERTGFISRIDYYVWNRTCLNLYKWQQSGLEVVPVSVNVSRVDFDYPNFAKNLARAVQNAGIRPELLHIEVTETVFSDQLGEMTKNLEKCHKEGFLIELDDFGSGYSSLNTLGSLPIDVIKLDNMFMKDIHNDKTMRILSSCITLTKSLGMVTVAEGVENKEQKDLVHSIGCDMIQGYVFSKPLSEDEFASYLQSYSVMKQNKNVAVTS